MSKTVVALFDTINDAEAAISDLSRRGVSTNDISLVANDVRGEYKNYSQRAVGDTTDDNAKQAASGALSGGGIGAALGLLVGLGALAIPGIGPIVAAGPLAAALGIGAGAATVVGSTAVGAGLGAATGGLVGPLVDAGVPQADAELYSEGVRRGGAFVMVRASDTMADEVADVLRDHNAVDIDERGASYRQSGWSGYDTNAKPYTEREINSFRTTSRANMTTGTTSRSNTTRRTGDVQGEEVLPVIEEQVQVGKRQVQRGGARIHTEITERPVEEQVTLREERVNVERRPVDRPVTDADTAFKDQSFELRETVEEPVVRKEARVVEEVVVNKDVREHTETVRETARRQDVHVHETEGTTTSEATTSGTTGFDAYDADFRRNYQQNFASSGYTYEQYSPIYRYGYSLANDRQYQGKNWNAIESDARTRWEERNPGTWEQFKDSIRYAWDRATNKA